MSEVERALAASGLDPACLTLEITESALMHNVDAGAGVVQRLHAMSVGLHLDDFGTGYSSLAYLHTFPVTALKIDRSFVAAMDRVPQQSAIVQAIVSLAHNLGMDVIAEGIETVTQAEALRALRCRRGQGFLFARPLPAHQAERLIGSDLGAPGSARSTRGRGTRARPWACGPRASPRAGPGGRAARTASDRTAAIGTDRR